MEKFYWVHYRFKTEKELTESDIQALHDRPELWIYVGEFETREAAIMYTLSH